MSKAFKLMIIILINRSTLLKKQNTACVRNDCYSQYSWCVFFTCRLLWLAMSKVKARTSLCVEHFAAGWHVGWNSLLDLGKAWKSDSGGEHGLTHTFFSYTSTKHAEYCVTIGCHCYHNVVHCCSSLKKRELITSFPSSSSCFDLFFFSFFCSKQRHSSNSSRDSHKLADCYICRINIQGS